MYYHQNRGGGGEGGPFEMDCEWNYKSQIRNIFWQNLLIRTNFFLAQVFIWRIRALQFNFYKTYYKQFIYKKSK